MKYTDSFEYWRGATLNATVKAESGYEPGTLSQKTTTLSGPITFTATEATDWTGKPKFTLNKNNYKGPFYLKIDSDWYKLTYTKPTPSSSSGPTFELPYSDGVFQFVIFFIVYLFEISVNYCDSATDGSIITKAITKDSFTSGGVFYNYFTRHKLKLTRHSDGYGIIITFTDTDIKTEDTYGYVSHTISGETSDTTVVTGTTDNLSTAVPNLYKAFDGGEDLTLEFIDA